MYEVCRVQKLSPEELAQFDDAFIDHLFELIETTRDHQDERLNYAVIRLIVSTLRIPHSLGVVDDVQVALNEQFMVSSLPSKPVKESVSSPVSVAPASDAPVSDEPESLEQPKTPATETHTRNHHRARTGSIAFNQDHSEDAKQNNRVLTVLMRRLGSSKTFGENVIFMLNRAGE